MSQTQAGKENGFDVQLNGRRVIALDELQAVGEEQIRKAMSARQYAFYIRAIKPRLVDEESAVEAIRNLMTGIKGDDCGLYTDGKRVYMREDIIEQLNAINPEMRDRLFKEAPIGTKRAYNRAAQKTNVALTDYSPKVQKGFILPVNQRVVA